MLETCAEQIIEKLPFGCFDVFTGNVCEMKYGEFKTLAQNSTKIQPTNVEEVERLFWENISSTAQKKTYSINNSISLFGDETKVWNLNNFTRDESIIHSKPSHRFLKVFQE